MSKNRISIEEKEEWLRRLNFKSKYDWKGINGSNYEMREISGYDILMCLDTDIKKYIPAIMNRCLRINGNPITESHLKAMPGADFQTCTEMINKECQILNINQ